MVTAILSALSHFIISVISATGYVGIAVLMTIESCNIPLPSEVIMTFSGFLVGQGQMNLWLAGIAGGIGCTVGSWLSWWLGYKGGRPLVDKYGKYLFLKKSDIEKGEEWFQKYGESIAFFSRLLPVVRTFISFPAGISKVNLPRFLTYTFLGSVIWSTALAWIGVKLGENWEILKSYFHKFDYAILIIIILGIGLWIWRHYRSEK